MEPTIEDRLWDYIDGTCNAQEKSFIEKLIATQQSWREKYRELLQIQQLLHDSVELDQPSMRFSQNVMEEITRHQITPATKTYINHKIIYGIGIFFVLMIMGTLIYGLRQVNWANDGSSSNLLLKYNNINLSKFFNNTFTSIFMVANVITGLMLLDRWMAKRKGAHGIGN